MKSRRRHEERGSGSCVDPTRDHGGAVVRSGVSASVFVDNKADLPRQWPRSLEPLRLKDSSCKTQTFQKVR